MALVGLVSQKGAPGTTLSALALAASWPTQPGRRKLLLEADADGGVLAVRYSLARDPGLLSLAAAGRHGLDRNDIWSHTQTLPGGLEVIAAPDRPEQATAAVLTAGRAMGEWLASVGDLDVIADFGRLGPSAPATELASAADVLMMVARPTAEQIQPAAERLQVLKALTSNVGWCLIGDQPYSAEEIERVHQLPVLGIVAFDKRGAAALEGHASPRALRRSQLMRSASSLASRLNNWLNPDTDHTSLDDEEPPDGVHHSDDPASGAEHGEDPAGEVGHDEGPAGRVTPRGRSAGQTGVAGTRDRDAPPAGYEESTDAAVVDGVAS